MYKSTRPTPLYDSYSSASTIEAADGTRLRTYEWGAVIAAGPPKIKALIALAHGYSEHARRHARLAEQLARRGYLVVALDHRWHGLSEGERATCDCFDAFVEDYALMVSRARERHGPAPPLFALGHSMGALIAVRYALNYQHLLHGLIVSGVALRPAREVVGPLRPLLRGLVNLLARKDPELPLIPPRLNRLSSNSNVTGAFLADELCYSGRVKIGFVDQLLAAGQDAGERLAELTLPLLILHGGRDIMTDPKGAHALYERASSKDKTLNVLENLEHEIFNEEASAAIFAQLSDWISERAFSTTAPTRPPEPPATLSPENPLTDVPNQSRHFRPPSSPGSLRKNRGARR